MNNKIILIGGGGHCRSCVDIIEQSNSFKIAGVLDIEKKLHNKILGYEIIGTDEDLPVLVQEFKHFFITIGQIHSSDKRVRLYNHLKELKVKLPVIVSPSAYVSKYAEVDEGTIIMHYAVVNANARIGRNCIINTKALIEHDAVIGDHCHISTGAIVNGETNVGQESFIGSNTVIREAITIGNRSIVGAGEKVMKHLPSNSIYTNK